MALVTEHGISPPRIYNVDETGSTVVQQKHSKVIALKGKKRVSALTQQERGKLVTMIACMNATGIFVPPMLIFPRMRMKQELMDGAPEGSIHGCSPSGWVQSNLFVDWFRHFKSHTKPCSDSPILLVLDGHFSHTKNLTLIDLAWENFVHLIGLLPHSSHRMQPLDFAFMGPLKTSYAQGSKRGSEIIQTEC